MERGILHTFLSVETKKENTPFGALSIYMITSGAEKSLLFFSFSRYILSAASAGQQNKVETPNGKEASNS
ncbi:hypothetical protein [Brevibacillus brevis]|uniref:Uncharacterized protein n=1 Tax=Brevibacillus brevis TaxID=1393 RepID=A0ABY9T6T1_BREBE|nr:hypothetical protein [Brevibacillus brevis]WNC15805.1 hypothetical protein RGB73_05585 [Brevibacillus brevis]